MEDKLNAMIHDYYNYVLDVHEKKDVSHKELEVRFGTKNKNLDDNVKPISKIDFENVKKKLIAHGYEQKLPKEILKVGTTYTHTNEKNEVLSDDVRLIIDTPYDANKYCKRKDLIGPDMPGLIITKKDFLPMINQDNYGFRIYYQSEDVLSKTPGSHPIAGDWQKLDKSYRHLIREEFDMEDGILVHMSTVHASKKSFNGDYIKSKSIKTSGIFNYEPTYEIEIEVNDDCFQHDKEEFPEILHRAIRIILSGLQQSDFPLSYTEKTSIRNLYKRLIQHTSTTFDSSSFIGPSSITLQRRNIIKSGNCTNIHTNYCVTDKADGSRNLLFITNGGKIYRIDTNMNFMYTGQEIQNKILDGTLIDGEYIKYDKVGVVINLFAAFDVYYESTNYVGGLDFYGPEISRYQKLQSLISRIQSNGFTKNYPFNVKCKSFEFTNEKQSINNACKLMENKIYEVYNKDGLIFTPMIGGE
jgi:hypothetical protein